MFTKRSNLLIGIPHLLFWLTYILLNIILVSQFLPIDFVFKRVLFIICLNVPAYLLSYWYLVPKFFIKKKYFHFYTFSFGLLFITIALRYFLDPLVILPVSLPVYKPAIILSLIFISQAMIVFIASLIGVAKESFMMDNRITDLNLQKKDADLQALKAKVNPHFLLNTLNNIYARTYAEKSSSAQTILQLSQLLRYTIYDSSKDTISLSREIETIHSLIGLYELKFEKKLPIRFTHPDEDELESIELPSMILFTLIENAMKHSGIGFASYTEVSAKLTLGENGFVFEIGNSKSNQPTEKTEYTGFGLSTLQKLLESHYGNRFELTCKEDPDNFHIHLSLPYEKA